MRCEKLVGLKVCLKYIDPSSYDTRRTLKSSVSIFSMYLFREKRVTAYVTDMVTEQLIFLT